MYGHRDLAELGEGVAQDGIEAHERAVQEMAFHVQDHSPGTAAVLADRTAPSVLRERAFAVASDVLLRLGIDAFGEPFKADDTDAELQQLLLDWQGQLAGWGA